MDATTGHATHATRATHASSSLALTADPPCTVKRIFLLGSGCFLGSGATTVFGTGIGLIFAASALSVAIALMGNLVLRSVELSPQAHVDPLAHEARRFWLAKDCHKLLATLRPQSSSLLRQTEQTNPTSTTLWWQKQTARKSTASCGGTAKGFCLNAGGAR